MRAMEKDIKKGRTGLSTNFDGVTCTGEGDGGHSTRCANMPLSYNDEICLSLQKHWGLQIDTFSFPGKPPETRRGTERRRISKEGNSPYRLAGDMLKCC